MILSSISKNLLVNPSYSPPKSFYRRYADPFGLSHLSPSPLAPSTLFSRSDSPARIYPIPSTTLVIRFNSVTVLTGTNIRLLLQLGLTNLIQRGIKYGMGQVIPASPTVLALNLDGFTLHLAGSMTYQQAVKVIEGVQEYMNKMGYGLVNFDLLNTQDASNRQFGNGQISR